MSNYNIAYCLLLYIEYNDVIFSLNTSPLQSPTTTIVYYHYIIIVVVVTIVVV